MRHIYYILAIIVASTILMVFYIIESRPTVDNKCVLQINDQQFSREDIARMRSDYMPFLEQSEEALDRLIDRSLLIQEAMKIGVDKREPFRASIQNFYEQTLIKTLIEEKYSEFTSTISETEIDSFAQLLNSQATLNENLFKDEKSAREKKAPISSRRLDKVDVAELSDQVKLRLIALQTSGVCEPIKTASGFVNYEIIDITRGADANRKLSGIERTVIADKLRDLKLQMKITEWLTNLRQSATIKKHAKLD